MTLLALGGLENKRLCQEIGPMGLPGILWNVYLLAAKFINKDRVYKGLEVKL